MTLGDYAQDIVNYLSSKLPGVEAYTLLEIAEFAAMKANNYASDESKKRDEMWMAHLKKNDEQWIKLMKKEK